MQRQLDAAAQELRERRLACGAGICYAGRMENRNTPVRLSDMWEGRCAAILLAVTWIASMTLAGANAYSYMPLLGGLILVVALAVLGLLRGGKVVRLGWPGWCSLAAGGYFLVRCLLEPCAVVESWRESCIICACFVFYGAGVLWAQGRGGKWVPCVLGLALLLNMAAYWLARMPEARVEWFGRPAVGLSGQNSLPVTLYVYKNFAGMFLMLAGSLLVLRPVWGAGRSWKSWIGAAIGLAGVVLAFFCGTRSAFVLLPLLMVLGMGLWLLLRIFSGRSLGTAGGVVLAVLVGVCCVAGYELFAVDTWLDSLSNVNSHLRYDIWKCVCAVAGGAPACGFGASSAGWMIVPLFNEWEWPNYAHNEYLQAWCDYGVVGVGCMLFVLMVHLVEGVRALASEYTEQQRRVRVAAALLVLAALAACAVVDFVWHDFSLAGMAAFACGVLGSPYPRSSQGLFSSRLWAEGSRPSVLPVRAMGVPGRLLLGCAYAAVAACCACMLPRLWMPWVAQWEYNRLARIPYEENYAARHALTAALVPEYPDTVLMDEYCMLPVDGEQLGERERLLKTVLAANPHQLFTVTILADNLMAQGRHREAEMLLRRSYPQEGLPNCMLNNWASYYMVNLLEWGQQEMLVGNVERAFSMMEYALNIASKYYPSFRLQYRSGPQPWAADGGPHPNLGPFVKARRSDVAFFKELGTDKDDSWQEPLEPGGKRALYPALQNRDEKAAK